MDPDLVSLLKAKVPRHCRPLAADRRTAPRYAARRRAVRCGDFGPAPGPWMTSGWVR
jgi:hypothetical protein